MSVIVLLLAGAPAAAQEGDLTATSSHRIFLPFIGREAFQISPFAAEVVALTNQHRVAAGCAPLTINSRLMAAAQLHSEDMALHDFLSHTGSNGSSPWDRMRAQGYNFSHAAENIAAGYPTPASVMDGWMNSPGHRTNILNCDLREIGVGYYFLANDTGNVNYQHYWTQDFGTP
ncbi:MAG: CAP domain-containing protein [Anaerolineales bacterium]|nr:CAP domain-containing protein [Anaerolineales bacterium]